MWLYNLFFSFPFFDVVFPHFFSKNYVYCIHQEVHRQHNYTSLCVLCCCKDLCPITSVVLAVTKCLKPAPHWLKTFWGLLENSDWFQWLFIQPFLMFSGFLLRWHTSRIISSKRTWEIQNLSLPQCCLPFVPWWCWAPKMGPLEEFCLIHFLAEIVDECSMVWVGEEQCGSPRLTLQTCPWTVHFCCDPEAH